MRIETSFLFDLDGTLVDSVYQHVLAWKEALDAEGIELSVWRIHRKIGMSGGLFLNQLLRETDGDIDADRVERLARLHAAAYQRLRAQVRPLPGARELLAALSNAGIRWAIATSGRMETAAINLEALGVDPAKNVVVTRDQVKYAKPDPDLFLTAAAKLNVPIEHTVVVGDSIWDMLAASRCRALGSGCWPAGTAATSWSARVRCACTTIRRICCGISTRLPHGRRRRRGAPGRVRPGSRTRTFAAPLPCSIHRIKTIQIAIDDRDLNIFYRCPFSRLFKTDGKILEKTNRLSYNEYTSLPVHDRSIRIVKTQAAYGAEPARRRNPASPDVPRMIWGLHRDTASPRPFRHLFGAL